MGPPVPQDQLRDPKDFRDMRDLGRGSKKKKYNKKEGDKKSKDYTNQLHNFYLLIIYFLLRKFFKFFMIF